MVKSILDNCLIYLSKSQQNEARLYFPIYFPYTLLVAHNNHTHGVSIQQRNEN